MPFTFAYAAKEFWFYSEFYYFCSHENCDWDRIKSYTKVKGEPMGHMTSSSSSSWSLLRS